MEFNDDLINSLLNCEKEIIQASLKPKPDRGNYRVNFELQSIDKKFYFSAFGRYNAKFPENFSVGLTYHPNQEKNRYEILRFNGPHGEHKLFPHHVHYHIHKITVEAMESSLKEDFFVEVTDKYATFEDALLFFVKYINLKEEDINKYFPGKDLQLEWYTE